tara:strand:+ start:753 stop:995 length:243 start_codon:yes stop_codon:yes gene_type:complete
MSNRTDPFVNLVIEPGESEFIALQRSMELDGYDCKSLILPAQQSLGQEPSKNPKLPREVQLYVGLLTVVGLYIVYRFTQK